MQPGEGALHHPPRHAQMAAVYGAPLANLRHDAVTPQDAPAFFAIVSAIGLHAMRFAQRSAPPAGDGSHAIEQWQELRGVVPIGAGQDDIKRDAFGVDEQVVLAARLAPIGRVRSGFFPPCTARTDELSAITREKSRRWAPRSLLSRTRCNLSHTPACCHSYARRQQLMPEPQPISCGSSSHASPDCKMKTMPVNTRRLSSRLRPARVLRGGDGGSKGSTISHSSSSTSGRAMMSPHNNLERPLDRDYSILLDALSIKTLKIYD
jgi:hypothetical protein